METFDINKRNALEKTDKSSKGSWDKKIIRLCEALNRKKHYFTTSSCAGRITIIKDPSTGKKQKSLWLFSSHEPTSIEEIKKHIKDTETAWLREEPFILHVSCRTINHAEKLLTLARNIGIKRSGIISLKKTVVEIIGMEKIDMPIIIDHKQTIPDEQLKKIIEIANQKLKDNWKQIERLKKRIEEL